MGAYGMDSHNCQRLVQGGWVRNDGGEVHIHVEGTATALDALPMNYTSALGLAPLTGCVALPKAMAPPSSSSPRP